MRDSPGCTVGLINLKRIDLPVGIRKSARVVLDVVLARRVKGGAGSAGAPNVAGPVAAECGIEDLRVF